MELSAPLLRILFCSLLAVTSSCALARTTINDPLDPAQVLKLDPGKTTAKQAVELLGAPVDVVQLGRRSAYRYDHRATKRAGLVMVVVNLFNEDTRSDRAWLFFDEDDVLSHVGATFQAGDTHYVLPWSNVHEKPEEGK